VEQAEQQLIIEGGPMANNQRVVVQKMALNKIKLGKNSRLSVSKEELDGLMQSIKEVGLLQPIGVAKNGSGYEICYGNRRFMACSKLGYKNIPVIVHERKKESDIDLKNLTENIQRRNIGLGEAGRYIELLKKEGLTAGEIGVRLGVSKGYIDACISAYEEVPAKFRNDLELSIGAGGKKDPKKRYGKIAITSAKAIVNAAKSYGLDSEQKEKLFSAAKSDERFLTENTRKYAAALKNGAKDPIGAVKPLTHVSCQFWMAKDDLADLERRFVDDGPFRSLNGLFKAILSGKKSLSVKIVEKLD
jgi:ParB/RepB/Spo0J family partition protein